MPQPTPRFTVGANLLRRGHHAALLAPIAAVVAAVVAALVIGASPVAAQPADPSGFGFLRIEPSARAAALGGSFSAVADGDINGLFFNPALLSPDVHQSLSLSYLNHVTDINAGFAAYGYQYGDFATIAGGIRYMNWGSLEEATETGERTGTFSAGDVALTVGASKPANDRWRYGANLHFVHSSVADYGSSAIAADVGVVYLAPESRLAVSASVNNLGVTLSSLGDTRDDLPLDVRLGLSKRFAHLPLFVSLTAYNLHDLGSVHETATVADNIFYHVAVGGEFQFSPAFNLRFGYNHRRHDELKSKARLDFAGVGLGIGIKVRRFSFDYAYSSWSELGGLNQLTVGTRI